MKKILVVISIFAGAVFFSSCGPSRYTVSEQPVAPFYERPVSPGSNYIWMDGDWYWSHGRYAYRNGYWARPRNNRAWVPGTWSHTPRGYNWRRGYWRR